jgi:hypothetical protein
MMGDETASSLHRLQIAVHRIFRLPEQEVLKLPTNFSDRVSKGYQGPPSLLTPFLQKAI